MKKMEGAKDIFGKTVANGFVKLKIKELFFSDPIWYIWKSTKVNLIYFITISSNTL